MSKEISKSKDDQATSLFTIMADCAPVLLWMSRTDSLCVFFNKTWLNFTGRTLEQEWGVGWTESVYFEDFQYSIDNYLTHFNKRTPFEMKYRLRRYDGEYRWILDKGVPYYDKEGKFSGFIGSCIDITESINAAEAIAKMNMELETRVKERTSALEKSQQELEAAKIRVENALRDKSLFISTVSHDLRTPLTAIKSSLDLIIHGVKGEVPEQIKPLLEIAHRNMDRMLRLINDILDVEKNAAGKLELKKKPQLLLPLIKQALAINALYAESYNVKIKLGHVLTDVKVNVDGDRIIQILDNLLSNAAKFTRPNTTVTVAMSAQDGRVCIAIKDHGKGISKAFAPKIFTRFTQKDTSRRTHVGSGLGLTIAKTIIELHQGQIRFETSSKGTTFFVELPEWYR